MGFLMNRSSAYVGYRARVLNVPVNSISSLAQYPITKFDAFYAFDRYYSYLLHSHFRSKQGNDTAHVLLGPGLELRFTG